jgi:hypothetical protein
MHPANDSTFLSLFLNKSPYTYRKGKQQWARFSPGANVKGETMAQNTTLNSCFTISSSLSLLVPGNKESVGHRTSCLVSVAPQPATNGKWQQRVESQLASPSMKNNNIGISRFGFQESDGAHESIFQSGCLICERLSIVRIQNQNQSTPGSGKNKEN